MSHTMNAAAPKPSALLSPAGLVCIGMFLSVLFTLGAIKQVFQQGSYLDPDDAMRMAQVRDWMGGQGWFDLNAARLGPSGVFMHWTRLVDVPLALLTRLFDLFAGYNTSERLMRLTFSFALLAGLFAITVKMAKDLCGPIGPVAAVVLMILGGAFYGYFSPGRLDHDHVAILFMMAMAAMVLRALDPAQPRAALWAGLLIAAGLSVSLETLPLDIIGIAVIPCAWIFQGEAMRPALVRFALGLGLGLLAGFAAVVAPAHYLEGACDTLSAAHLAAGLTGSLLCLGLAGATGALPMLWQRLAAGLGAGLLAVAAVKLAYPACLADPYAGLDPMLARVWLANVSEARPLFVSLEKRPAIFAIICLPILMGLAGAIWAAAVERGVARARWLALAALVLAGCAASIWQVRATGVVAPLALLGSVWLIARFAGRGFEQGKLWAAPALFALALPMTASGFGLLDRTEEPPGAADEDKASLSCRAAEAYVPLAALPEGTMLGPINHGAHLLAMTRHRVIAAPFHRNVDGNLGAIRAFMAEPEAARAMVKAMGVRYVLFCPGADDMYDVRPAAPQGFGAQLVDGKPPAWLKPLELATPFRVYEVK